MLLKRAETQNARFQTKSPFVRWIKGKQKIKIVEHKQMLHQIENIRQTELLKESCRVFQTDFENPKKRLPQAKALSTLDLRNGFQTTLELAHEREEFLPKLESDATQAVIQAILNVSRQVGAWPND
jgi:hypothetical protein